MSHVQNDTRKIVKLKDITEGITRMMVLDLRAFGTVEGVSFNELYKLVPNPFSNLNSFGNPGSFENLENFGKTRLDSKKISCSRLDSTFRVLAHLY